MKIALLVMLSSLFLLTSCKHDDVQPESCGIAATVKDYSNLDGCGFVFVLDDGQVLHTYWPGFCGTPPLPKEITEDPLYNFQYVDGKKVKISYEPVKGIAAGCMGGEQVKITCITEVESLEK
ncbi:MAG TPA: hypothetical protein VIT44_13480 [Cyclobacteriaceae bacterium]